MLELRILTGLHRGAALPLDGDTIRIGSGTDNDIALLDPGMPEHAGVLVRTVPSPMSAEPREMQWRYHAGSSARSRAGPTAAAPFHGTPVVAGTRWFAGPVLLGCDEEDVPWPVESVPPHSVLPTTRGISARAKLSMAIIAAITVASLAATLAARAVPTLAAKSFTAGPAAAGAAKPAASSAPGNTATPSVRAAKAIVYPSEAIARPTFGIRSASGGPYGFLVTDDGQTLIPGSRWKAFTLVRIEPDRAIFSGPHAAELRW